MNNRQRVDAVLHYRDYDRLPVAHFGYWEETLEKWKDEGHLTDDEISGVVDGNEKENRISERLGFDLNWFNVIRDRSDVLSSVFPSFERRVVEELPDGMRKVANEYGVIELEKTGVRSIPTEIDHLLKDRKSWEELFKPRLQFTEERIDAELLAETAAANADRTEPLGLHCGSLFGQIRNAMGLEGVSYLYADDEELYDEIIATVGELCYRVTRRFLEFGVEFDFAHFWEDICYRGGPLVPPPVFRQKVGPHYRRITDLTAEYGIDIVSLDCDGKIDALIPVWLENGVNTMFPMEVGTWNASIAPWREKYGPEIRGVGGMNKNVFAEDFSAVDAEVERLKPLVDLGGYIPCVDHRIPPTAAWDNVRYYCDRMREVFG